jgi:hypothetical protein
MRKVLAAFFALLVCSSAAIPASAGDVIRYVECRADNETAPSIFGIDETTKKVCDRSTQDTWFSPSTFDAAKIVWNDGGSTKAIYRTGKDKRYEHDILILVHIGRCKKAPVPAAQLCRS